MSLTFDCPHCHRSFELTQDQYMAEEMFSTLSRMKDMLDGGEAVNPALLPVTLRCRLCGKEFTTRPAGRPFFGMVQPAPSFWERVGGIGCLLLVLGLVGVGGWFCFFEVIRWWFWDPSDRRFTGHQGRVSSVVFSPDGKRAASRAYGDVRVWDLETGSLVRQFNVRWEFTEKLDECLDFSADGSMVITRSDRADHLRVVDVGTNIQTGATVDSLPQGHVFPRRWITPGRSSELREDTAKGEVGLFKGNELIKSFKGMGKERALSPDGKRVLLGNTSGIVLWDAETGKELKTIDTRANSLLVFSPDSRRFLSRDSANVYLWDVASGKTLQTLAHAREVDCLAFAPDGRSALTAKYGCGNCRRDGRNRLARRRFHHALSRLRCACRTQRQILPEMWRRVDIRRGLRVEAQRHSQSRTLSGDAPRAGPIHGSRYRSDAQTQHHGR